MNILYLSYNLGETASGIINARIVNELEAQGHNIYVIVENICYSQLKSENIKVYECRSLIGKSKLLSRIRVKLLTWLKFSAYNSNWIWRFKALNKAKKIIRDNHINWIFARTTPIDPCMVGVKLKRQFNINLYCHFSDPLPPPSQHRDKVWKRFYRDSFEIITNSDLISYGTTQMYEFIQSLMVYDFSNKFIHTPDVMSSSELLTIPQCRKDTVQLLFLGNIYGNRNPSELFKAIEELNRDGIQCYIKICSVIPNKFSVDSRYVNYCGYVSDVITTMAESDILVDLDMDDTLPVYMSSKLKDYLMINRPILCITTENSPSFSLLKDRSSCRVTLNESKSIKSNIKDLISNKIHCYDDRLDLVKMFSPKVVVSNIIQRLNSTDEA